MPDQAEIRDELRAVARDLLGRADRAGTAASPGGASVDWRLIAAADWLGLEVSAGLGGAAATFAETAVIAEELGRAAARSPYLGAVVLSVGTLNELQPCELRDRLLGEVAAGAAVPAAVLGGGDSLAMPGQPPPFRLARTVAGAAVYGQASFVPDAAGAGWFLLLAADTDGSAVVVVTDSRVPGLTVTEQPVLDATRSLARVRADGAEVSPDCIVPFAGDARAASRRLLDRAAVAMACDSLGLSEAMLAATVDYARVRQQFGRPIGSFQAVKHACADMLVHIRIAGALVADAVQRVADPGCSGDEVAVAASMAKSYACDAAVEIAGQAMQLHGGIGYTWESGIHVYLKRAVLNRDLFGSPLTHRRRLAARYA
jgi:alkylation response protein AidB-like acyl-CoA dehydrogenase